MYPKFTLIQLRVIVLSILLLIEISLVPAMQTGIYGQLLQQQQLPVISIKITSPTTGQQVQLVKLQYQEHQQIIQLLIVQYMLIGIIQSHFKKL